MAEAAVTAVIPCFNHGQYVRDAVNSVLGQTYLDLRVIVVNDGSTDPHTLHVLASLPGPRVEVLHKGNEHVSAARNHGIRACSSKYVLTLDADDSFERTFIEKAVAVLDADTEVGAVTCGARFCGCRSGVLISSGGQLLDFLVRNCARASSLFRRQCWSDVGGYDESMRMGYEDWDFWIRLATRGWRIHALPEVLLNYRCSERSMVTRADAIRPQLVRGLVQSHSVAYREHVADVLYMKELQIQSLETRIEELRGSLAHRIGRCVTEPSSVIRSVLRKAFGARHQTP